MRQNELSIIINIFTSKLPLLPFLGRHFEFQNFHTVHFACGHTFLQLSCFWFSYSSVSWAVPHFMQEVRPTMFMGVPWVWEKIKEAVELQVQQTSGFKNWAFEKASVSTDDCLRRVFVVDVCVTYLKQRRTWKKVAWEIWTKVILCEEVGN